VGSITRDEDVAAGLHRRRQDRRVLQWQALRGRLGDHGRRRLPLDRHVREQTLEGFGGMGVLESEVSAGLLESVRRARQHARSMARQGEEGGGAASRVVGSGEEDVGVEEEARPISARI
jgi:hypothetical protein